MILCPMKIKNYKHIYMKNEYYDLRDYFYDL